MMMQRLRRFGLVSASALSLACVGLAHAEGGPEVSPESLAASRELLALTNANQMFLQMMQMMAPQIGQLLEQANPQDGPLVRQLVEEMMVPEMTKHVPEIIDDIAAIYGRTFTQSELSELIAFYESSVDRKFADRQPALLAELGELGQAWGERTALRVLRDLAPKLRERGIEVPI
jgi:hypothetical protein